MLRSSLTTQAGRGARAQEAELDESGAVDFYTENYREIEGHAQYDAWISGIGEPFDFTGESYLEEWARPLREMTPHMERFTHGVEDAWQSLTRAWCSWPTLTQADLEFIAEIDQCIFDDGDYFLEQDPDFLADTRKLQILAMGRELSALSRDFWTRLHDMGAVPRLVREANHLFLLRECGEEIHENLQSTGTNSRRPFWITCPTWRMLGPRVLTSGT